MVCIVVPLIPFTFYGWFFVFLFSLQTIFTKQWMISAARVWNVEGKGNKCHTLALQHEYTHSQTQHVCMHIKNYSHFKMFSRIRVNLYDAFVNPKKEQYKITKHNGTPSPPIPIPIHVKIIFICFIIFLSFLFIYYACSVVQLFTSTQ